MADLRQKSRTFLIIVLVCILLLCFAVYLLRTPERRVVTWLNSFPEFQSSPGGFQNARLADRDSLLDRVLDRNDEGFDYDRWYRAGSKIPDVHKILADLLTSHDTRVDPADIIAAMEFLGPEQFIPQLLEVVRSPGDQVRDRAIHALFMSRDSQAIDPLLRAAESDPNPAIRADTIVLLAQWEDSTVQERLQPLIQSAMDHENQLLRRCAIAATHIVQKRKRYLFPATTVRVCVVVPSLDAVYISISTSSATSGFTQQYKLTILPCISNNRL